MAARLAQVPIAEADAERVRANMGELLHFVEYIQQIDTVGYVCDDSVA
jgi:Asp-tRNA(Asn)/Glu-tRNA(Gln) amidotransferase C subunit